MATWRSVPGNKAHHAMSEGTAGTLADLILLLHAVIVAFVVLGLPLIALGGWLGWRWIRVRWLRLLHLATIAFVATQAWLGETCPLTLWEQQLRLHAGQQAYDGSFIEHWLARLIFFDAPPWLFVIAYTLFGLAVAAAWWRWPPQRAR